MTSVDQNFPVIGFIFQNVFQFDRNWLHYLFDVIVTSMRIFQAIQIRLILDLHSKKFKSHFESRVGG